MYQAAMSFTFSSVLLLFRFCSPFLFSVSSLFAVVTHRTLCQVQTFKDLVGNDAEKISAAALK